MNKVLIIDDSGFMRSVLKDILSGCTPPVEVHEAHNMETVRQQLKKVQPSLVLLDIVMDDNEHEGVDILKEIKDLYPGTKVIMLSSVGQVAVIEECIKLGAVCYIEKPFDKSKVLDQVNKCLA